MTMLTYYLQAAYTYIHSHLESCKRPQILVFIGFFLLVYGIYFWIKCRLRPITLYQNESGSIKILPSALKKLIETICKGLDIQDPSIYFRISSKKLYIRIHIHLNENKNLLPITKAIQERLTQILKETLNLEHIGSIDIIVKGIQSQKHPPPSNEV